MKYIKRRIIISSVFSAMICVFGLAASAHSAGVNNINTGCSSGVNEIRIDDFRIIMPACGADDVKTASTLVYHGKEVALPPASGIQILKGGKRVFSALHGEIYARNDPSYAADFTLRMDAVDFTYLPDGSVKMTEGNKVKQGQRITGDLSAMRER